MSGAGVETVDAIAERIPTCLRERPQWVLWRNLVRDGDPTKVPFQTNGRAAKSNAPDTWTTFDKALSAFRSPRDAGLGFVFAADDDFCGIDFDGCRNPDSGETDSWAMTWIERLDSYTEVSPTGTGFKVWIEGKLPAGCKHERPIDAAGHGGKSAQIELFDRTRFFAVTGDRFDETSHNVEPRQSVLDELLRAHGFIDSTADDPSLAFGEDVDHESRNEPPEPQLELPLIERARRYLLKPEGATKGSRDNRIFSIACRIIELFGPFDEQTAFELMSEYNRRNVPPVSEGQVREKVRNAIKHIGSRAGAARDATASDATSRPPGKKLAEAQKLLKIPGVTLTGVKRFGKRGTPKPTYYLVFDWNGETHDVEIGGTRELCSMIAVKHALFGAFDYQPIVPKGVNRKNWDQKGAQVLAQLAEECEAPSDADEIRSWIAGMFGDRFAVGECEPIKGKPEDYVAGRKQMNKGRAKAPDCFITDEGEVYLKSRALVQHVRQTFQGTVGRKVVSTRLQLAGFSRVVLQGNYDVGEEAKKVRRPFAERYWVGPYVAED